MRLQPNTDNRRTGLEHEPEMDRSTRLAAEVVRLARLATSVHLFEAARAAAPPARADEPTEVAR